jgi:hypothetical protein
MSLTIQQMFLLAEVKANGVIGANFESMQTALQYVSKGEGTTLKTLDYCIDQGWIASLELKYKPRGEYKTAPSVQRHYFQYVEFLKHQHGARYWITPEGIQVLTDQLKRCSEVADLIDQGIGGGE